MNRLDFILVSTCIITFTSCNTQDSNSNETALANPIDNKVNDAFVGLWSINIMFGDHIEPNKLKATLLVKRDSTFVYHDENDYGQNFSEGKWSNDFMFIILKSFDKYKPALADNAKEKNPLNLDYESYKPKDTIRVNFDNIRFTLKNDTLISLDKRGFFNHLLFVKFNNNKINTQSSASWMEFKYDQ